MFPRPSVIHLFPGESHCLPARSPSQSSGLHWGRHQARAAARDEHGTLYSEDIDEVVAPNVGGKGIETVSILQSFRGFTRKIKLLYNQSAKTEAGSVAESLSRRCSFEELGRSGTCAAAVLSELQNGASPVSDLCQSEVPALFLRLTSPTNFARVACWTKREASSTRPLQWPRAVARTSARRNEEKAVDSWRL